MGKQTYGLNGTPELERPHRAACEQRREVEVL